LVQANFDATYTRSFTAQTYILELTTFETIRTRTPFSQTISCNNLITEMNSAIDKKEETFLLRIKSSNASSDVTLPTPSNQTVNQLKESIQQSLGQVSRGRYIRLIHSGRLLAPDNAPISNFKLKDGSVIHAIIAAAGVRGGQQAALSRPLTNRRRLRGAGVGSDGLIVSRRRDAGGGEESDEDDEDLEAGVERMGFDRLRADGLSRSEIGALRIYFSSQIDRFTEQRNALSDNEGGGDTEDDRRNDNNDEDDLDPDATERNRRFRMEDEWMETQGSHSEFRLNLNASNPLMNRRNMYLNSRPTGMDPMYTGPLGTDRDFLWGFVLGYLVGFMMMFWVWMPTVPHRQKLGILTGICFHMGLNIMNGDSENGIEVDVDLSIFGFAPLRAHMPCQGGSKRHC